VVRVARLQVVLLLPAVALLLKAAPVPVVLRLADLAQADLRVLAVPVEDEAVLRQNR
jgi:hypothetical protein